MPSLQVREMPENLYQKLVKQALSDHRSIAQETVALLSQALDETTPNHKKRRQDLLAQWEKDPKKTKLAVDPVKLIREDRNR